MGRLQCKVVLVGDCDVGKSCLALRFVRDTYCANTLATVGAAFLSKKHETDGRALQINLWDTGGAERYRAICPMYVRGADAVLICYDLTRPGTVATAHHYVKVARLHEPSPLLFVVGCKSDLVDDGAPYLPDSLRSVASDNRIHLVSARENRGIQALFDAVGTTVAARHADADPDDEVIRLSDEPAPPTPRCSASSC